MKNLRLLRESGNLSQQKLADKFGLAQSQIHSYESGAYEPDISTLRRFAEFFETSVDYIIGDTEIRHRIEHVSRHDLNAEESTFIEKYRKLSIRGRASVMTVIDTLLEYQ